MRCVPLLVAALGALGLAAGPAFSDVAFPARLEVVEISPGDYAVSFTLPIVEGRKLRAEPSMPPTCHDVSERQVTLSVAGHTTTFTSRCVPASLAGEAILVHGLLGTQTDLALTLRTLDGRVWSEILRASRPGFLVPEPPSPERLAAVAALSGMRRALRQLPLWLLLLTAVLLGARGRELVAGAVAFAVAHGLGQWLGENGWLAVPLGQRDLFVLATVAVPAVALAGAGRRWRGWVRPLWPLAVLAGLLYGGAVPQGLPADGLSDGERLSALAFFNAGVALGLALMAVVAAELETVLRRVGSGRLHRRGARGLGYAVGAVATGLLLLTWLVAGALPAAGPGAPVELVLLALVLGPALVAVGWGHAATVPLFAGLVGMGVTAALLRLPLPLGRTLVLGTLLLLGMTLAVSRPLPVGRTLLLGAVAIPAHAWFVSQELVENVSRSTAAAVGLALFATCVLYASLAVSRELVPRASNVEPPAAVVGWWRERAGTGRVVRSLGIGVAVLAAASRLSEYGSWFDRQLATEAALGLVRLPLLALLLALAAVLAWPRRRRVLVELGIERRARAAHWVLLAVAWLALPYGTVTLRNPFFEPHAPRGEDARRVVARVLSDTYQAFNLSDEDELYDTLAESVTGELVDDLYLDSRRRLTAGTREGAQVTVREVSVLEIGEGEPEDVGHGGPLVAYDCRWVVTARVQHLQHVHHRRNVYNGVLALRVDGERWKIARVELRSEEREVVSWAPS